MMVLTKPTLHSAVICVAIGQVPYLCKECHTKVLKQGIGCAQHEAKPFRGSAKKCRGKLTAWPKPDFKCPPRTLLSECVCTQKPENVDFFAD
jgi:hypothetical protein